MTTNEEKTIGCIEIEPETPAKMSVIWLHGLGADGSDFIPIVPELHLPADMGVRFIFPHAPVMPVTINQGYEMRAWYDIVSLSLEGRIDHKGIASSVSLVNQLIAKEQSRGMETSNILLAGFSQGAVIALTTGINYPKPLKGILALSGYLPFADELAQKTNKDLPIFIAHGTEDPIVPYALGKAAYVALKQAGYPVTWRSYPMQHGVSAAEINDISQWMRELGKKTA